MGIVQEGDQARRSPASATWRAPGQSHDKRRGDVDAATLKTVFWLAVAVLGLIVLPLSIIIGVRQHLRATGGREKTGASGGGAMGNAFAELDRLVARPAIEYTIEAETPILKREDDQAGH